MGLVYHDFRLATGQGPMGAAWKAGDREAASSDARLHLHDGPMHGARDDGSAADEPDADHAATSAASAEHARDTAPTFERDEHAADAAILRPRLNETHLAAVKTRRRRRQPSKPAVAVFVMLLSIALIALSWYWEPATQWASDRWTQLTQTWSHWAASQSAQPLGETAPIDAHPEAGNEGVMLVPGMPALRLDGIALSPGGRPTAVINGTVVAAGGVIDGFAVKAIESDRVTVEADGQVFHLQMPRG
jgi:hypothetical protein